MDIEELKSAYIPMSETAYYILLSLTEPRHGYSVMQYVQRITSGRIRLGAGTLYGSLAKMEKGGLIKMVMEERKRKVYRITDRGCAILEMEIERIGELYGNRGEYYNAKG